MFGGTMPIILDAFLLDHLDFIKGRFYKKTDEENPLEMFKDAFVGADLFMKVWGVVWFVCYIVPYSPIYLIGKILRKIPGGKLIEHLISKQGLSHFEGGRVKSERGHSLHRKRAFCKPAHLK
jgi:hypothetical protein